jgi:UTP--glucose-1-phosphate uridylyltransferase
MKIRKAIIPAAGLGTRFLPATKAQPKEMLPIVDKPAIQFIVEEAVQAGIEDIIIVTGRNKRAIEDHFDKSMELEAVLQEKGNTELLDIVRNISNLADVHYIRQKQPLGLGHAVLCARKFIGDEPFAVLLGDDIIEATPPCLKQMMDVYETEETSIVAVQRVPWEETDKYGIVSYKEQDGRCLSVDDLIEKPPIGQAPSNVAVIGRYVLEPEIFRLLEQCQPGRSGEIQLTDALQELNRNKPMLAYLFEGKRYDVGDKFGYIVATIESALRRDDLRPQLETYLRDLLKTL